MKGSVYQRGSRWYFRHDVGIDRQGQRKQRSGGGFPSEAEARRELARSILRHEAGQPGPEIAELLQQHAQAALTRILQASKAAPIPAAERTALARQVAAWGWKPGNAGENRIIQALHGHGVIPEQVEQQFSLGPFRLDLAWVRERVAIEADGWVHGHVEAAARDVARDTVLTSWGWAVHRVSVDNTDDVFSKQIAAALDAAERRRRG